MNQRTKRNQRKAATQFKPKTNPGQGQEPNPDETPDAPANESPAPTEDKPALEVPESEKERWARIKVKRDANKASRAALGSLGEQKLVAAQRDGFYRRWINDDGNRLAMAQNKGYDFVIKGSEGTENVTSDDPGDKLSQLVGLTKTNQPMRAYLMEIPSEWRDEDQEEKESVRRETEESIRRTTHGGGESRSADGSSVMYVPTKGPSHFQT